MGVPNSDDVYDPSIYEEAYDLSIRDPEGFWGDIAREELEWISPWDSVIDFDPVGCTRAWFTGGTLNASVNCLDRHVLSGKKVKAALIWQGEAKEEMRILTYGQLLYEVNRFANVLRKHGVGRGDRVSIYLPMIPELAISMLACARIGAVHNVILAGFSADAIKTRIEDSQSKLVITSDGGFRGGGLIPLKFNVDIALSDNDLVERVVVVRRTGMPVEMVEGRDIWWSESVSRERGNCPPEPVASEDPLFMLFTSGFTSAPKGVCHSTAGYLLHALLSYRWMFHSRDDDVHWCTGDIGWITGHTYTIYGPLCAGATTIMYEGAPLHPGPERYWEMVEKYGVNSLYTTPTIIRALKKDGEDLPGRWDLTSLRVLGCVGESISPDTLEWYRDIIGGGRCPVVNSWWQTETGGTCMATFPCCPGDAPGSVGRPFFGVIPRVLRENGSVAERGEGGLLYLEGAWPGMMTTVAGDHDWYRSTYFGLSPELYFTGDRATVDDNGDTWILGRVDDVIKISGHRIGSVEVEHVLGSHDMVANAAVVPVPHRIKGEAIYCFMTLVNGTEPSRDLEVELIRHLRGKMGAIVTPERMHFCPELPMTKNGKVVKSILRKVACGDLEELGDVTGLANPSSIRGLILTKP